MGYKNIQKATPPGLGGWTYQGDVALGDPPAGGFYVDQTSMSSGTPTFEINVTDAKGISHLDWLQDLVAENHIVLRNRIRPSDSLILEISSNAAGAGFQTIVGTITSGNGTFLVGATYDIWTVTTADDFVVGPASSVITAIPTFTDTTGKVIGNNTTLQYDTGEVQLASTTSAIEIQEHTSFPASAAGKGHVWVRASDDALIFTNDIGTAIPIVPPNTVVLGEWTFGGSSMGATAVGEFETNNATLALISSIRFNASPNFGQSMLTWAGLLPQEGILYLQDISDPGGTSVTFPYRAITFPLGPGLPQFDGNILATNGVDHGTNWSTNDYSLKIVAAAPSLDSVIISPVADNDVIVPSANPIILRDNAANITTLKVTGSNSVDQTPALEIQRPASTDVGLQIVTESFIPDDYIARWDSTTSDGMTFTTSEVVGDIATWTDETSTYTLDDAFSPNSPIWDTGQVVFDGSSGLIEVFGSYVASDGTWIICGEWDGVSSHDYMLGTPNEVFVGNNGGANEKILYVLNASGSPLYESATDLTDEPVVATVTNKHNGVNDNDKEVWLGTTYLGGEFGQTDALSDNNTLTLGYAVSGSQATIGTMYELIIYDRVLSPEEIANVTNELSIKWSAQTGDGLSSVSTSSDAITLSLSPTEIVPSARILEAPFTVKPELTTYAIYPAPSVLYTAGAHTGSLRGGNLTLDAGASTSGTNGIVTIGAIADEILLGKADMPGFTITEGTDHPTDPNAGRAQLWVKSDYQVPVGSPQTKDGQVLMMTDDTGLDIEMSWLAANYKPRIGALLAFAHIEENATFAGGTAKATADSNVYFIYDHLSNMWYQSWIDVGTGDAQTTSSDDGGYSWVTAKEVDTAINAGKLSPPCTNGTNLGIAADGYFYLSTSLSASDLPATGVPTGTILAGAGHRGLVWSEQQSLWVTCSFSGGNGYIHTSPDGITWTNRTPVGMTTELPASMDIAHSGWHGFTGTERIIISCGATGTMLWFSLDGGLTWTEDTSNVPSVGLETIMWCPSVVGVDTATTNMGIWIGVDASSNLWYTTSNLGTTWLDTTFSARCLFRTPEFCGWGNTSTNQTFYKFDAVTDATIRGVSYSTAGVLYANGRFMHSSNESTNRTRYQWGNGVIMFDRMGDGELMIGRYGPITPV